MVRAQGVGGQGVKALGGKGLKDSTGADRAGEAGVPAGYKRTEVGVVPVEWEVVELSKLCEIRGRVGWKGYTKKDLVVRGAYAIGAMHITSENLLDLSNPTYLSRNKFEESPEIVVLKGDVLIVQRGSIGKVVLIDRHIGDATINPSVLILRSHSISSEFLYSFLASKQGQKCISDSITSTSVPMITQQQVGVFPIPLPPLPEQRVIAGALGEADALLAALDGLIAKKAAVKQATLEELLSGRRRLGGYEGKHSEHNLSDWQKIEIGKIAKCYSGGTPSSTNDQYYGGAVNWITSSELNQRFIKQTAGTITEVGLEESSAKLVEPYSLLLALYGATAGTPAITMISGAINQAVLCIECLCDVYYLFYWLECNKEYVINTYTQGGQPNLSGNIVKDIVVNLPPQVEQRAIATLLTTLDDELTALRARREKLAAVKAGMMEQLLTGAVRLV